MVEETPERKLKGWGRGWTGYFKGVLNWRGLRRGAEESESATVHASNRGRDGARGGGLWEAPT